MRGALLLAMATVALGCGAPRIDLSPAERELQPADYPRMFDIWTRNEQVLPIDGIDNVLTVSATMLSDEFRRAYVAKVAHDLRLSTAEREELSSQELVALERGHEFFITLMSGVNGADDLDPERGPWRLRLEDDSGRRVVPASVEEVRKPTTAETQYFSFLPKMRRAYRVVFPAVAEDGQPILMSGCRFFSLTFSSPLGNAALRWQTINADQG